MTPAGGDDRHLLTVLHAAEPTGPPLFALQFLRWLRRRHPEWATTTLLVDGGGGLEADFEALGPVVVAGPDAPFAPGRRLVHRALIARQHGRVRRELAGHGPFDVVHVHCAGTMRIAPALPDAPLVCHVHELDVGTDLHLGPLARRHLGDADRYVAASDHVRDAFATRFAVDPARIERHWEFIEGADLPGRVDRGELGLAGEAFVVVSSGVRHWRKAPELFVRTALAARRRAPEVPWRFVWVGGTDHDLEALVARAGLDETVTFLAHQPRPQRWFAAADAFFLPAREDAFPLVCVEAAAVGCPIVTFDNGGATELVQSAQCGTVVPFGDVEAAAAALADLAHDPTARAAQGARARRFAHEHLVVDRAAPALLTALDAAGRAGR